MMEKQTNIVSNLVSVIIPAYNAADFISKALESVQGQTYTAWEIIVVEDGTQDGTEDIVKRIEGISSDCQVRCIRHLINKGASAARNTGITESKGEYIALLDHDDTWKPCHLESLIRLMDETSSDLVFSPTEFFHYSSHKLMGFHGPNEQEWANFPSSLLSRNYVPASGILMRRDTFNGVGEFDTNIRGVEDLDYWLRCLQFGNKFGYFPEVTNGYRQQSPEAITSDKIKILELHALLLRKHSKLTFVSKSLRNLLLARYHRVQPSLARLTTRICH